MNNKFEIQHNNIILITLLWIILQYLNKFSGELVKPYLIRTLKKTLLERKELSQSKFKL